MGRGNSRLVAWEGERTVTFTMEDALISPEGFMILSGAGLIEAGAEKENGSGYEIIYQHVTERVNATDIAEFNKKHNSGASGGEILIPVTKKPYLPYDKDAGEGQASDGNFAWIMLVKDDEIISEPFIPELHEDDSLSNAGYFFRIANHDIYDTDNVEDSNDQYQFDDLEGYDSVIVDYYTPRESGAKQIEITADKFGGNYYLEASTLFRTQSGVDMPAEFIIPNCKIQSNFTFTMASTGDPSTFTFTMDAFPDYTRFDRSKKVLAAIQIIDDDDTASYGDYRKSTPNDKKANNG